MHYGYYFNISLFFGPLNKSKTRFFVWEGGADVYDHYNVHVACWVLLPLLALKPKVAVPVIQPEGQQCIVGVRYFLIIA